MKTPLTSRLYPWLVGIGLLLLSATRLPAHSTQSYDFRLSNVERQLEQVRLRLDQVEQAMVMQRSEANRPQVSPEAARWATLERQQELIMGRLVLMERAWQTSESTLQQLLKEREGERTQKEEKQKKDEPKSESQPPQAQGIDHR